MSQYAEKLQKLRRHDETPEAFLGRIEQMLARGIEQREKGHGGLQHQYRHPAETLALLKLWFNRSLAEVGVESVRAVSRMAWWYDTPLGDWFFDGAVVSLADTADGYAYFNQIRSERHPEVVIAFAYEAGNVYKDSKSYDDENMYRLDAPRKTV